MSTAIPLFLPRHGWIWLAAALASAFPAHATEAQDDWGGLHVYQKQDANLIARGPVAHRLLFLGDSITEGWDRDHQSLFADPRHINRGISGQTTSQMLLRFRQDVVALRPETLFLLGGTNDIAGNGGQVSDDVLRGNIETMVELAQVHGIRVVLLSLLPTDHYWWAPEIAPVGRIRAHNAWLKDYAARKGIAFVDLYDAMATEAGAINPAYSEDGVHPNAAGYAVMERLLRGVLR